ncbi:M56 family metallopeptidase [Neobacillus sp. PS3-12]|uniref:M56 family metallopeptidase n=1 Tax=Neobacillus sp. PS3-12 TaxID=3070677 RepID=UPI0027DF49DF|nr:M56 family metallopeptidase [Neobacillus sp. PS3-12]WML52269.1 M56 family metallopeptidase [Neobacillus sp. PS3-12]
MSNLQYYVEPFFNWVIKTSLFCSVLVGIILLVKLTLRDRLPVRWHYILWLTLIFRLLLPPLPDGVKVVDNILPTNNLTTNVTPSIIAQQEYITVQKPLPFVDHKNIQGNNYKKQPLSFEQIAFSVWLLGVICIGVLTVFINVRLYLYVKRKSFITDSEVCNLFNCCKETMSIKKRIPLVYSGRVSSPTVLGFIRPKFLLSQDHLNILNKTELEFVFYHELAHIKRNDVFANCLMNVLLILHWFNPILWYAYFHMRQDQEIGCDALALTYIKPEKKIEYGYTLIKLVDEISIRYPISSLANMAMGKGVLKRRIIMIKQFEKKSYRWSLLGVFTLAILLAFSLIFVNKSSLVSVYKPGKQKENYQVMMKDDIFKKMQTSFNYFKTAKGKMILHSINNGIVSTNEIDYEAVNNSTPSGYNKVLTTNTKTGEKLTNLTYYNQNTYWDINKSNSTYKESGYIQKETLGRTERLTANKDKYSINVYSVREYPLLDEANFYLFPYEIANTYLDNSVKWKIEKQNEEILGHNTLVIKGELDQNLSTSFRFWVDKDTGILVKYETYNKDGKVLSYLDPKELTINGSIDTNELKPNLKGLKR